MLLRYRFEDYKWRLTAAVGEECCVVDPVFHVLAAKAVFAGEAFTAHMEGQAALTIRRNIKVCVLPRAGLCLRAGKGSVGPWRQPSTAAACAKQCGGDTGWAAAALVCQHMQRSSAARRLIPDLACCWPPCPLPVQIIEKTPGLRASFLLDVGVGGTIAVAIRDPLVVRYEPGKSPEELAEEEERLEDEGAEGGQEVGRAPYLVAVWGWWCICVGVGVGRRGGHGVAGGWGLGVTAAAPATASAVGAVQQGQRSCGLRVAGCCGSCNTSAAGSVLLRFAKLASAVSPTPFSALNSAWLCSIQPASTRPQH